MPKLVFWLLAVTAILMPIHNNTAAVEILSAEKLAAHCDAFPEASDSTDGQYCIRYIQGFIDGAVVTDVRVMENVEAESKRVESLAERAFRTRLGSRSERQRAAAYAEFCLGDPVPLKEVVTNVVNDLKAGLETKEPARDSVYNSLRKHYPCKDL